MKKEVRVDVVKIHCIHVLNSQYIKYLNERSRWTGEGDRRRKKGRDRKRAEFIAHKNMRTKVWKIQEGVGVKRPPGDIGSRAQGPPWLAVL